MADRRARRNSTSPISLIAARYPMLASAILAGVAQLRNMASTGGNLLQRTRCYYFMTPRHPATSANLAAAALLRGPQPHARDPRHERGAHRDASSDMCGAGRAGRQGPCDRAGGERDGFSEFIGCRGQRRSAIRFATGRDRHGGRASSARLCGKLHLPENPRSPPMRSRLYPSRLRWAARDRS